VFLVLTLLFVAAASGQTRDPEQARRLYKEAQKAERAGDAVRAYSLYSQSLAHDPYNVDYWLRSQFLRPQATLQAGVGRAAAAPGQSSEAPPSGPAVSAPPPLERDARPPVELRASAGRKDLDFHADARALFTKVAGAYGLEAVFDTDYPPGTAFDFRLAEADYRDALRALEAATASFVVPVAERLFLVVKDTPQKRTELEPVVSVAIPIPTAITPQHVQEVMRGVQQAMALTRVGVDSQRGVIIVRDRLARVRPAQQLIEQLLRHRAMVSIEVEFLESASSSSTSYGASLQTLLPLLNFGRPWNSQPSIPAGFVNFAVFGGGKSLLGLGLTSATVFARQSSSVGRTLFRTQLLSVDGQQARLHVGERFPIVTARYLTSGQSDQLFLPPTFNFEDLGLLLQFTPHVHVNGEVTLELDAELKALTGQSVEEIPVIANRKLQSVVRLRQGEWGVIAGLLNRSQARTISGMAGLSRVPILGPLVRRNTRDETGDQVLVILKPSLVSLPPGETPTIQVSVGPEQRPRLPL